jgi:phosphate-selective porin OprO/OprP
MNSISKRLAYQRILVLLLLALAITATAKAQEPLGAPQPDLERRVRELEETVQRLRANQSGTATTGQATGQADQGTTDQTSGSTLPRSDNPPGSLLQDSSSSSGSSSSGSSGGGSRSLAGWDNGFFLRSQDNRFVLRITGQIQTDYRAFLEEQDQTDIDTIILRRARFGIEANMLKYYEFRFLPDFGQGNAVIQDSYMNIHYVDWLQFEVGKFKQPFSYEQLIQDRYVPTMERSMIDQLVPARDVGGMIHGQKLFGDHFDYAIAVSNGEINGNGDTNENKDLNGRIAWRPFSSPYFSPWLHYLQVGVSGSIGVEHEPINPNTLKTPATVPWFHFNSTVTADGDRSRWSPELAYFYGGLGFAAQYFGMRQDMRPAPSGPSFRFRQDVPFEGFYFMSTYLLTGERRTGYSEPIDPLRPFNPCSPWHCPGAWELVVRVSRLEVGDEVFAPGLARLANPVGNSDAATELTVGFNWYFNKYVRMQMNYEHAWFAQPVLLGPNPLFNLTKDSDALLTRFQIIF